MKKIALLLSTLAVGFVAQAQVSLTGTSYTQNFDNIGSGLPMGWELDSNATATNKGTAIAFDTNPTAWSATATTTGKGRNVAAKGSLPWNESLANQTASTNRAFGLRQVGALDSQVAYTLQIANTTGLTSFNMSFKLMSLDSTSPRVTTWRVDYGFGNNPTSFTDANASGTLTTGGYTFSSNTINVNFGSALNNQAGPVWIRIVALNKTTGSGNRATTGIDDVMLTWTGAGAPNYRPTVTSLSPANNATGVALGTNLMITFDRQVTKGTGNIMVTNQTDHQTQTIAASATTVAGNTVTIPGVNLLNSKTYYVMFDSTAFDTAGYKSYGIYDSTSWKFTTVAAPVGTVTSLSETFDNSCATGLPAGWQQQNVTGTNTWGCSGASTAPNYYATINGGGATTSNDNEDWLITPQLAATANMKLYFKSRYNFAGPNLEVLYSTNYSGTGAPSAASWNSLLSPYAAADSNKWVTKSVSLPAGNIYIAFKYTSTAAASAPTSARRWDIDSVFTTTTTAINSVSKNNTLGVQVLGAATNGHVMISFDLQAAAEVKATIYDMAGREVFNSTYAAAKGNNKIALQPTLQSGMYIIRLSNGKEQGIARTFVQ